MPLNFEYQLDDVGGASIIGADGAAYRVNIATGRPDDPRGPALVELTYSCPGVRAYSRVLYARDVVELVNSDDGDELDTLARMAVNMLEHPHPLAGVRDAARARRVAIETLGAIEVYQGSLTALEGVINDLNNTRHACRLKRSCVDAHQGWFYL